MANSRGIELKEDIGTGHTGMFPGDKGIIMRVMQNLLINAVQHSPPGFMY